MMQDYATLGYVCLKRNPPCSYTDLYAQKPLSKLDNTKFWRMLRDEKR